MPGGSGVELIRSAARVDGAAGRSIPIIMVTGSATDEICEDALDAGAQAVFSKPFIPALLRAAVDLFANGGGG